MRTWRWLLLAFVVLVALAAAIAYFTAPRTGGEMDAESTAPDGARALVTLLRDRGVEVIVVDTVAGLEQAARPDSQLLVAGDYVVHDDDLFGRIDDAPGDLLLVAPLSTTRTALAPEIRQSGAESIGGQPNCELPEASRAGLVRFGISRTYDSVDDRALIRCYDGAVVRYEDQGRTVTVLGTSSFMTNSSLLEEGNAALAMNLAGLRPRLIWYVPEQLEGEAGGAADIVDLIPDNVGWIVWQLCLVVVLAALWQGRRMGPLVAENLPVVVRASETVEGRGRLYRSRRARDRSAEALRTAACQRMLPRLGLAVNAAPQAVVNAIAQRSRYSPEVLQHLLFGSAPGTDGDLVMLAQQLDDIERQVANS